MSNDNKIKKVLMIGPARNVKGGITTVVDNYYKSGLSNMVELKYIESCNDKNIFSKLFKEIIGLFEYKKCINNYDLIHIHMASRRSTFRKAIYVKIAKRKKKKVILHIHGAEFKIFWAKCTNSRRKYITNILNMADNLIVLSEEWKDFFDKLVDDANKVIVLYNSVVIPPDFNKDLNTNKILFLGRIGDRKGIFDLIDVFEELVNEFPNLLLYIGGDGEVDRLKNTINLKKLNDSVKYIGWVTDEIKAKFLTECSFYILPSYNEGMPMSVLEGMAYKNITISTNVGGISKIICNEENGIIIEPGDKNKLREYIIRLLHDEYMRKKLSNNARLTIINKFDSSLNLKKLLEIYGNLL